MLAVPLQTLCGTWIQKAVLLTILVQLSDCDSGGLRSDANSMTTLAPRVDLS